MLSTQCRKTLFSLLDRLKELCAESHSEDELDTLEEKVNITLASLEKEFPLHLQNITTHILHHVVSGIKRYGPVYGTWMYVFERFDSWICKRALNMKYPEATVMETFIVHDWCQFMEASGKLPPSFKLDNMEENQISEDQDRHLYDHKEILLLGKEKRRVQNISQCTCT